MIRFMFPAALLVQILLTAQTQAACYSFKSGATIPPKQVVGPFSIDHQGGPWVISSSGGIPLGGDITVTFEPNVRRTALHLYTEHPSATIQVTVTYNGGKPPFQDTYSLAALVGPVITQQPTDQGVQITIRAEDNDSWLQSICSVP
jgi:hypothetical protein